MNKLKKVYFLAEIYKNDKKAPHKICEVLKISLFYSHPEN